MDDDSVKKFGSIVPYACLGQPAEFAFAYVTLASDESSDISDALVTVAGTMPVF